MRYFVKNIIFTTIVLCTSTVIRQEKIFANSVDDIQYVYMKQNNDPSYNIFTNETWEISPYIQAGYSFLWASNKDRNGVDYQGMLRNGHNGFNFGLGIILNKYWSFGLSFHKVYKTSTMRGYNEKYPYINSIKQENYLINLDIALMAPFEFFNRKTRLYFLTGPSFIFSNLEYNYNQNTLNGMVPVEQTKDLNKMQIGINVGFGLGYNLTEHLYARVEGRKIFVVSKDSALTDTWSFNFIIGSSF